MTYKRYPPNAPRPWALILVVALLALTVVVAVKADTGPPGLVGPVGATGAATYQGKGAYWWAQRAQQARRDANARRLTIQRLRRTLRHTPSIQESVQLATIAYPQFSSARAWQIIEHESACCGYQLAKNRSSSASGLYQFLTSTWASTPYGRMSIWSPYAQSLAAGWMHSHGRTCEWQIGAYC